MVKYFCDRCEQETPKALMHSVTLTSPSHSYSASQSVDVCEDCRTTLVRAIAFLFLEKAKPNRNADSWAERLETELHRLE